MLKTVILLAVVASGFTFMRTSKVEPRCRDPNEVWNLCANEGCRKWNCSTQGILYCLDPVECKPECVCRMNYTRRDDGLCIPERQCEVCTKPHEHHSKCANSCPPRTCDSIGRAFVCLIPPKEPCVEGCQCDEGYYRNSAGKCVSEKSCKKCPGPNEYFGCGGACDNICAILNKQNQTNCPVVNVVCNSMCYCEPGYARNYSNICIPISECPPPTCDADEYFEECPETSCQPLYCEQLGYPVNCNGIRNSTCPGNPRCICDFGRVRDHNGKCIPRNQCHSCGGDKNAVPGCGNYCGRTCSDYKAKNVVCPLYCYSNGCDCKQGYVYDSKQNKCVLPSQCTK